MMVMMVIADLKSAGCLFTSGHRSNRDEGEFFYLETTTTLGGCSYPHTSFIC